MDFEGIILNSGYKLHDLDAVKKYINLCSAQYTGDEYSELHHILPKSMFAEYANNKENLVRLKYSDHIEAHKLLCDIFNTYGMKLAHMFMTNVNIDRKLYFLKGDSNPAKDIKVREKISKSKLGKPRNDLKGLRYFGADQEIAKNAIEKMRSKIKNTVVVKDREGNRFRVSVNDERYVSGELVPFNLGSKPNSGMRNPEVAKKCIDNRNKSYEKFSKFTYDEMVDFLIDAHNAGKNIFPKPNSRAVFSKNYSSFCKRTKFDQKALKQSVVQRLSKG